MSNTTPPVDTAREIVAKAVAKHGATPVARAMGKNARTLLSWLAGAARPSTDDSMRSRVTRLAVLDA